MPFSKPNQIVCFSIVEIRMVVVLTVGILNHVLVVKKSFECLYLIVRVAVTTGCISSFQRSLELAASFDGPVSEHYRQCLTMLFLRQLLVWEWILFLFTRLSEYITACYLRQTVVIDSECERVKLSSAYHSR